MTIMKPSKYIIAIIIAIILLVLLIPKLSYKYAEYRVMQIAKPFMIEQDYYPGLKITDITYSGWDFKNTKRLLPEWHFYFALRETKNGYKFPVGFSAISITVDCFGKIENPIGNPFKYDPDSLIKSASYIIKNKLNPADHQEEYMRIAKSIKLNKQYEPTNSEPDATSPTAPQQPFTENEGSRENPESSSQNPESNQARERENNNKNGKSKEEKPKE